MTYPESISGKKKHWTQKDLATCLGLAEITVTLMETQNKGLDSIERRQLIATLLKIPPAFLGLASLEEFAATLKKDAGHENAPATQISSRARVDDEMLDLYQSALDVYESKFAGRTITSSVPAINRWIERIQESATDARGARKLPFLRILWSFHLLLAKTCGYDLCDWIQTFKHLDEAKELAEMLDDPDLRSTAFCYSGNFYLHRQKPLLARIEFDASIQFAQTALPQTRGSVYAYASLAQAMAATDLSDGIHAQKLLDKAERYTGTSQNIIRFAEGDYLKHRAKTLIALQKYGNALECLDDAEEKHEITDTRPLEYLNILRAECFLKQKRPAYEQTIWLLRGVAEQNQHIKEQSHLNHALRLFKLLAASPYGNSPEVADLGISLRKLQFMKEPSS
jgi:transcriptional regulator with XRE-family HTH domain